jgi:hypothetical protein
MDNKRAALMIEGTLRAALMIERTQCAALMIESCLKSEKYSNRAKASESMQNAKKMQLEEAEVPKYYYYVNLRNTKAFMFLVL